MRLSQKLSWERSHDKNTHDKRRSKAESSLSADSDTQGADVTLLSLLPVKRKNKTQIRRSTSWNAVVLASLDAHLDFYRAVPGSELSRFWLLTPMIHALTSAASSRAPSLSPARFSCTPCVSLGEPRVHRARRWLLHLWRLRRVQPCAAGLAGFCNDALLPDALLRSTQCILATLVVLVQ